MFTVDTILGLVLTLLQTAQNVQRDSRAQTTAEEDAAIKDAFDAAKAEDDRFDRPET